MRTRLGMPAAVALAVLLGATALAAAPSGAQQADRGHVRYQDHVKDPWRRGCRSDTCLRGNVYAAEVATPGSAQHVDVVVTATLDLRTSRGDYAEVLVDGMAPAYRVDSPSPRMRTSTTLVWEKRDVPAGGEDFDVSLWVSGEDGPDRGSRPGWVKGANITIVVDMLATE